MGRSQPFIRLNLNPWSLGFLFLPKEGQRSLRRVHSFMESFAHGRRRTQAMEMRSDAWGFEEEAASFPCGRLGAACFHYLLELFYIWGGRMVLAGYFLPGSISSHQISVRSVAEWGHQQELHSCGGVFHSGITVDFWSIYSGSGSFHEGRTIQGRICLIELVYQLSWSCYCIKFHHLLCLL